MAFLLALEILTVIAGLPLLLWLDVGSPSCSALFPPDSS